MLAKTIQNAIESYNHIRWFAYFNRSPIIIQLETFVQDLPAEAKLDDHQLYSLAATISAPEVAHHHATKYVIEHSLLAPLDAAMPSLYRLCTLAHKHGYLHELTTMAAGGSLRDLCNQLAPFDLPDALSYRLLHIWTQLPLEHRSQDSLNWLNSLAPCQLDNGALLIHKTSDIAGLKKEDVLHFTSTESLNSSTGKFEISAMKTEVLSKILSAFSKLAPALRHFENFKLLSRSNVEALRLSDSTIHSQSDLILVLKHAPQLASSVAPGDDLLSKATTLEDATQKAAQAEALQNALRIALSKAGLDRSSNTAHYLTQLIQCDERRDEVKAWKEVIKDRHHAIAHSSPERTLGALFSTGAIKVEEYHEFKSKVIAALDEVYDSPSLSGWSNKLKAVLTALTKEDFYRHPPFSEMAEEYCKAYISTSALPASALLIGARALPGKTSSDDTVSLSR